MVNVGSIEGLMDELAASAGRDPIDFRLDHIEDWRAQDVIQRVRETSGGLSCGEGLSRGLGFARYKNSSGYCAVIAEVEIDEEVRPRRIWSAADVGEAIDLTGTKKQIEGGIIQAMSIALYEKVWFENGRNTTERWDDYRIATFQEVPELWLDVLHRPGEPVIGAGEIAAGPTIAAFVNAVARGLGIRPDKLPLSRETLIELMA